jgi:hypothetical protein
MKSSLQVHAVQLEQVLKDTVILKSYRNPYLFYLLTAGVEVVYLHLITLIHTPQLVGLRWTRDRPVAETSTWNHKHYKRDKHPYPGRIRTHDLSTLSAADQRLKPGGHWDRQLAWSTQLNIEWNVILLEYPAHNSTHWSESLRNGPVGVLARQYFCIRCRAIRFHEAGRRHTANIIELANTTRKRSFSCFLTSAVFKVDEE